MQTLQGVQNLTTRSGTASSRTIEILNFKLIAARNWKTKTFDMVLGGIIGAIISLLMSLTFDH